MENLLKQKEKFIGLPFYVVITIFFVVLGIITTRTLWQDGTPGLAISSAVVFIIHIGFYWVNRRLSTIRGWWIPYYAVQMLLIFTISMMPNGANFLATAITAIIAEALSIWGNTRHALTIGMIYTGFMVILFVILLDRSDFFRHLIQVFINGGIFILIWSIVNQQFDQRVIAEELAETLESVNAKLVAFAARNEALTLQAERERMARELHDTLAQGVAGLILQLEALKAYQEQGNYVQVSTVLSQAITRARSTLSESRAAIEDLRSEEVDFKVTIEMLVAQFDAVPHMETQMKIQLDDARPVPAHFQHHARRVLHEALTNINKHAGATLTQIDVHQTVNTLSLKISDNGVGFDTTQPPPQGHFGLQGLSERARLTNSQYTLTSAPGVGTTIKFLFPLQDK